MEKEMEMVYYIICVRNLNLKENIKMVIKSTHPEYTIAASRY